MSCPIVSNYLMHNPAISKHVYIISVILLSLTSCKMSDKNSMDDNRTPNHLVHESSPYLLQHAYNPVEWYPWSSDALEKAKEEDKLLLISIGYAACHWCHVMEHESFEDDSVAQLMNAHFVNIKVDREERPDLDDIYMTACQMVSGRGCGWPLNAVALPDGRPIWAGTYFPKAEWKNVLQYFHNLKATDYKKLELSAEQITRGLNALDEVAPVSGKSEFSKDTLIAMANDVCSGLDLIKGGRQGAPKFPMPVTIDFLQSAYYYSESPLFKKAYSSWLDAMANGGIYDHLGGGFSRYTVDQNWLIPHFEKMLYDNGQLLSVYANAYKTEKSDLYKSVMTTTLSFLQNELMSEQGGFYSSLDADSEGEEGKYYVWTTEEMKAVIKDAETTALVEAYFNFTQAGNWEHHKNILHVRQSLDEISNKLGLSKEDASEKLKIGIKQLHESRSKRIRPGLDDKILCSWNALLLQGIVDVYTALGRKEDLELAKVHAQFMTMAFLKDNFRLDRNYKDGQSSINGFLDDYSLMIKAFISLYEVTFEYAYLEIANGLTQHVIQHFIDDNSPLFFYTSDLDEKLVARKKEKGDNVIPASNSVMARNLLKLGHLFDNESYLKMAHTMMHVKTDEVIKTGQASFYSNWASLYAECASDLYEIAIVGEDAVNKSCELQAKFLPNAIFLGGKEEGHLSLLKGKLQKDKTMIYVCQNKVCQLPTTDINEALRQMTK